MESMDYNQSSESSPKEAMNQQATAPPAPSEVATHGCCRWHCCGSGCPGKRIFLWEDPVLAGIVFVTGNLFFYLITRGGYSVLTLTSYIGLTVLCLTLGYTKLQGMMGKKVPWGPVVKKEYKRTEKIDEAVEKALSCFSDAVYKMKRIVYCEDMVLTVKTCIHLAVLAVIGKIFAFVTLLKLAFVGHMIFPVVYKWKKAEIDAFHKQIHDHLKKYLDQAAEKVPALAPFLKPKAKDE